MSHPTRPRIAYVTLTDPAVSDYISGMPHQMWKALSGIVLPLADGAESYAARHTCYAEASLDRAHTMFTWSAWGKGILDLIEKAR